MRRLILAGTVGLVTPPAAAHEGHEHGIGWTLGPEVVVPLVMVLLVYLIGLARLRRRSGRGRRPLKAGAWRFLAGWLILAGALASPLHAAGEVSFTMHMIEHELIMLPAALLLVAARPGPVMLWGLPAAGRNAFAPVVRLSLWGWLVSPLLATALQALALIIWHMPALFDRALVSEGWHIAQHLTFVVSALMFWRAMLPRSRHKPAIFISALCLFLTSVVGAALGALMALDASPWYASYEALGMTPFGLTPAEDQQLAGVIMWVPGGLFHLTAALLFVGLGLRLAPEGLEHGETRRD
jgi:putative membrane protein